MKRKIGNIQWQAYQMKSEMANQKWQWLEAAINQPENGEYLFSENIWRINNQ
jgi:hypothetical protein